MPYENEQSNHSAIRRIAENPRVRDLLSSYQIQQPEKREQVPLTTVHRRELPATQWQPSYILAIDGSFKSVSILNGYPGAEAAYITVACVLQDIARIRKLDEHRPVLPTEFRKTQDTEALDHVLPGCNVVYAGDINAKVSFRRTLYDLLKSQAMADEGETLLDTYEILLKHKPDNQRVQHCPLDDACPLDETAQNEYKPHSGVSACRCKHKHPWFSTDALRIHERMLPYGGSNDRIYSEVIQVLERIWIVHILRTLRAQKWLTSLKRIAILVDGPLAIFGQPAWISQAISKELIALNSDVYEATGMDVMLLGIEKTGEFINHFEQLDQNEQGGQGNFPNQTAALLTDAYIKRNIYFSDSDKPYGMGTYFGRKLLYKTITGERIVATLPYLHDNHKDWDEANVSQFPRLADAMSLMDELISSRYKNALDPIVMAHAEATLPSKIGNKVLEKLARELTVRTI
jgi:hypothetical protein